MRRRSNNFSFLVQLSFLMTNFHFSMTHRFVTRKTTCHGRVAKVVSFPKTFFFLSFLLGDNEFSPLQVVRRLLSFFRCKCSHSFTDAIKKKIVISLQITRLIKIDAALGGHRTLGVLLFF